MHLAGRAATLAAAVALAATAGAQAQAPPTAQPVNRSAPVVTQSGSTLTTTSGAWVGATRPFTYAWLRCTDTAAVSCIAVPGQTRPTYTLTGLDAGARLRSRVTASNPLGSRSAVSAPSAAVPVPAPTATGPRTLPRLSPFPVVVVTGRTKGARTRITGLLVRGPTGLRVRVSCRGRCRARPFSRRIGRSRRVRLTKAQLLYRAGAIIEIRMASRTRVGKFVRLRIRKSRAPARLDRCLAPRASRPMTCS